MVTLTVPNRAGAVATFLGTTRDIFESKRVSHLEYEAYESMAVDNMKEICSQVFA